MANFVGALLGAMLVIYLASRLIEWIAIKRMIASHRLAILTSTSIALCFVFILWFAALGKPYAQGQNFIFAYILGAILLIPIRISRLKDSSPDASTK